MKSSILLFNPAGAENKFGRKHAAPLQDVLGQLVSAQEQSGVSSELVLLPGQPASDQGAHEIKKVLDSICGPPRLGRSYLLVGGGDMIPLFSLPDPTRRDEQIFSDRPFGALGADEEDVLTGSVSPVGRLPGEPGSNDPGPLERQIRAMIRAHSLPAQKGGVFGLAANVWRESTEQILEPLSSEPMVLQLSEPVRLGDFEPAWLEDRSFLHFNLHGRAEDAFWRGTGSPSWKRRRAVEPSDFLSAQVEGAVVFAQCCFGARTRGRTRETSIVLALLSRGIRCFVGCLETSYGVDGDRQKELEESDIVAKHFWRFIQSGERIGQALFEAQRAFAAEALASPGGLDEDDRKTLLTFVLYGDPTLIGRPIQSGEGRS